MTVIISTTLSICSLCLPFLYDVSSLTKLGFFIRRLYLFIPGSVSTLIPIAVGESIYMG